MPKQKVSTAIRLRQYVTEFGEQVFSTDGSVLFCKVCEIKVAADKRFTIQQHIARDKHLRAVKNADKRKVSQLLLKQTASTSNSKSSLIFKELCEVFVSANIPLGKLNNSKLRDFLERHTGHTLPDESTLRKNYLIKCYEDTLNHIRECVNGKKIYVSIDESTDSEGRYVANVVIGTLETNSPGQVFLLTSEVLEAVNHSQICKLFDKSMYLLWPNGIQHESVLLFLTDAAPYMVKAAKSIKSFYTKLVHVTCLAHAFHRVAEEIRSQFSEVDRLISTVKKVFVKAPSRTKCFKDKAPGVALPPEPILTRWGTWLTACIYYCDNFQIVREVVNSFDRADAKAIGSAQDLFSDPEIEGKLACIKSNFAFLPETITHLEKSCMPLEMSIELVNSAENCINNVNAEFGEPVRQKLKFVLGKNKGFQTMCQIACILSGKEFKMDIFDEDLTASDIVFFKYAPITSVEVERSFSKYKTVLADNRRSFTFDNLRMTMVVYCNSN